MTTFIARGTQVHQALLVSHLTPFNPQFTQQLSGLQNALTPLSAGTTAHHQVYGVIYSILQQQASLLAYVDMFRIIAIVCLLWARKIKVYLPGRHALELPRRDSSIGPNKSADRSRSHRAGFKPETHGASATCTAITPKLLDTVRAALCASLRTCCVVNELLSRRYSAVGSMQIESSSSTMVLLKPRPSIAACNRR
jgi:hypothetical protein